MNPTKPDYQAHWHIFGSPSFLELVKTVSKQIFAATPDWTRLQADGRLKHENINLRYARDPGQDPDPYFGGEIGGECLEIESPDSRLKLIRTEIAWTSPELSLLGWGSDPLFLSWQAAISTSLDRSPKK